VIVFLYLGKHSQKKVSLERVSPENERILIQFSSLCLSVYVSVWHLCLSVCLRLCE
jgi:hypothetical protein